jgi:hypothetical protein
LAGAQAARGPVMSVRTFRLTRSGENPCRTSSNFTSSDGSAGSTSARKSPTSRLPPITIAARAKHGRPTRNGTERIDKAAIGDLVRITGRIGQSKYKVDGETHYSVDLIADSFAVLAKAKVRTVKDDMEE